MYSDHMMKQVYISTIFFLWLTYINNSLSLLCVSFLPLPLSSVHASARVYSAGTGKFCVRKEWLSQCGQQLSRRFSLGNQQKHGKIKTDWCCKFKVSCFGRFGFSLFGVWWVMPCFWICWIFFFLLFVFGKQICWLVGKRFHKILEL